MHERTNPVIFPAKADKGSLIRMEPEVLKLKAEAKNLPEALGLDQIAVLLGKEYHAFLTHIVSEPVRIAYDGLEMVIFRDDYRDYLKSTGTWPLPEECLLSNWWSDDASMVAINPNGKTKLEKQHDAILEIIKAKKINPMKIPDGGKVTIQQLCETDHPLLFDGSTSFDNAWRSGRQKNLFKMENHHSFSKRGRK